MGSAVVAGGAAAGYVASAISHDPTEVAPGIRVWKNPKNRFTVARVHYTADPAKRSPDWRSSAKAGMPERGWLREMEISFATPEGEPVFPEFDPARMVQTVLTLPEARLLRGWDFGHVSPCVVFGQLDAWGRLRIIDCLLLPFSTAEQLIEAARQRTWQLMGRHVDCFDAGDPAGESLTDLGQIREIMARQGLLLHTQRLRRESYEALRERLLGSVLVSGEGVTPKFLVHPRCATLVEALSGAFHLSDRPPFRPVDVHPYKDCCDALRYLHDNLLGIQSNHLQAMKEVARADWAW